MNNTLVLNLFGGPGTGKSTTATGVFHELKHLDIECELAYEKAKEYVYEERHKIFTDQIYMFAKQFHQIFRLMGKVDVIVTDSPILLTPIYDFEKRESLEKLVIDEHKKMWSYNVFLKRVKKYNPNGRNQTEPEAQKIDLEILDLLDKHQIPYETVTADRLAKDHIVKKIQMLINPK